MAHNKNKHEKYKDIDLKHYNPLNDFLFSKYMAEEGCEERLLSFLNAFKAEYNEKISNINLIGDKLITGNFNGEKNCILDLRACTYTGERFLVEVQQKDENDFRDRSFHYLTTEYTRSAKKGNKNRKEAKYKSHTLFNILNFQFCKGNNFHEKFNIHGNTEHSCIYTDKMEIYNIDLVNFRKQRNINLNNKLNQWSVFFSKNNFPLEIFKKVLKMNPEIKSSHEKIKEVLEDSEAAYQYERLELKVLGEKAELEYREEKGRKEETMRIAIKLKEKEFPIEEIVDLTGLSLDEIKKI